MKIRFSLFILSVQFLEVVLNLNVSKVLNFMIMQKMGLDSEETRILEEHKRLLEEVPDMELTEKTKKLRQACFKANYKNKRSLAKVLTLHSQKSSC